MAKLDEAAFAFIKGIEKRDPAMDWGEMWDESHDVFKAGALWLLEQARAEMRKDGMDWNRGTDLFWCLESLCKDEEAKADK